MKQVLILDNEFSRILTHLFLEESRNLGIEIVINQCRESKRIIEAADINFFSTDNIGYSDLTRLISDNPSSLWYPRNEYFVDFRIREMKNLFAGEYSRNNAREIINIALKRTGANSQ